LSISKIYPHKDSDTSTRVNASVSWNLGHKKNHGAFKHSRGIAHLVKFRCQPYFHE